MSFSIKPCPWCGDKDVNIRSAPHMPEDDAWQFVQCGACTASGPWRANPSGAVESWNRLLRWSRVFTAASMTQSDADEYRELIMSLEAVAALAASQGIPGTMCRRAADVIRSLVDFT